MRRNSYLLRCTNFEHIRAATALAA